MRIVDHETYSFDYYGTSRRAPLAFVFRQLWVGRVKQTVVFAGLAAHIAPTRVGGAPPFPRC